MGVSKPVISLYDKPMWDSMARGRLELQACSACGTVRYPPAPICAHCLSMDHRWAPVSGRGTILSWVIFHKQYFDDHPPPYNAIAVRLAEGPIIMTNLVGELPEGDWIGAEVELEYAPYGERTRHQARLTRKVEE